MSDEEAGAKAPLLSSEAAQGRLFCRVRGRVQGVGFRWYVQDAAMEMSLSGYVKNCPDGSVEIAAEGPRESLERLLEKVRTGPAGARVTACDVTWSTREAPGDAAPAADRSSDQVFQIRY